MMEPLLPNFLKNSTEYESTESLWRAKWQELIKWIGQEQLWTSPWINTKFANGTPFRDGNPIFSAVCFSRSLGIRVIQHESSENARELVFWIDTFAEGEKKTVKELVISCALTQQTLNDAQDLMYQWITEGEVRLSWIGYPRTSVDALPSPEGHFPVFPIPRRQARTSRQDPALCH